jgi:hypothetical protein
VGVPPLLDDEAREWEEAARMAHDRCCEADDALESSASASTSREPAAETRYDSVPRARRTEDGWLYLSEIVAPPTGRNAEIEQEVQACFQELEGADHCFRYQLSVNLKRSIRSTVLLAANEASLLDLAHLTVYLSPSAETMALFPRINAVYATYFGTSPPTRACVAVPGPQEAGAQRVKLEGVARVSQEAAAPDSDSERKALHIQSMSYWAPANIGPYSQSINVSFIVQHVLPCACSSQLSY